MSVIKALEFLGKSDVLLASGSLRRLELLTRLDIPFLSQLAIPESVENLDYRGYTDPKDYVLANIANKLQHALQSFPERICRWKNPTADFDGKKTPALTVAADTVVVSGKEILEKPQSAEDNARMLRLLSGRTHSVITAVSFCMARQSAGRVDSGLHFHPPTTFAVETEVKFAPLDEATIAWYVNSKEGRGKAGGYAIQGLGAGLVESVHGCFYNVIGFPLNRFLVELSQVVTTGEGGSV